MYTVRPNSGLGTSPPGVYDCSGAVSWLLSSSCWSQTRDQWAAQYAAQLSPIAPPGAPTGSVLTVPPASGADAQATVDELLNQQLADQQAKNAAGVTSSWWDTLLGAPAAAGGAVASAFTMPTWAWIGLAGIAAFALVSAGGGSPRRYGR